MKKLQNRIKLGIILGGTIIFCLLFFNIYRNFEGRKINTSYISKHVSTIDYKELSNAITELSGDTLVYISYVGDKDVYNLEKKITKVLKDNDITDNVIYVDTTKNINDKRVVTDLNKVLKVTTRENIVLPAVIYFKDNTPTYYVDSANYIFDVGAVSQLIDIYGIGKTK